MVCVSASLLLFVLTGASTSPPTGMNSMYFCPPRWTLSGRRCFAFYPAWSSWSTANSMCSHSGGNLASLHTRQERLLANRLAKAHTPVWLGGHQENASWSWSDKSPFRISSWIIDGKETTAGGGACLEMKPKSGDLHGAHCEDLRFYICSMEASSNSSVFPSNNKPVEPGLVPGVRLIDVLWGPSSSLVDQVVGFSPFVVKLRSGQLTRRCYASFVHGEALYLGRVGRTLKALISELQEEDETRSLLQDTLQHYRSKNQVNLSGPPPQWLNYTLQSFHDLVLEEPVYWLVALLARSSLWNLLVKDVPPPTPESSIYTQQWSREGIKEVHLADRYIKVIEQRKDQMDVYKAINIFRVHMLNQRDMYKAVDCGEKNEG